MLMVIDVGPKKIIVIGGKSLLDLVFRMKPAGVPADLIDSIERELALRWSDSEDFSVLDGRVTVKLSPK